MLSFKTRNETEMKKRMEQQSVRTSWKAKEFLDLPVEIPCKDQVATKDNISINFYSSQHPLLQEHRESEILKVRWLLTPSWTTLSLIFEEEEIEQYWKQSRL